MLHDAKMKKTLALFKEIFPANIRETKAIFSAAAAAAA